MPFDPPEVIRGRVIRRVEQAVRHGGDTLEQLPGLLVRIIKEGMWRGYVVDPTGEEVTFSSFEEFVTTNIPQGMGTTVQRLKHLCRDEPVALDAIDQVCRGKPGKRWDSRTSDPNNVDNVNSIRPTGNSRDAALRRLRDQRPDLHRRVLAGELSPHAAMIEAGFRKRPEAGRELRKWWRKATDEERGEFLDWIQNQQK